MELGRIRPSVAGCPDEPDYPAARHRHSFTQIVRIMIQVRVVETVRTGHIEFVYRDAASAAQKQLPNCAVVDRMNRRAARLHDVNRLVTMSKVHLVETVVKIRKAQTLEGRRNLKSGLDRRLDALIQERAENEYRGNRGAETPRREGVSHRVVL